MKNLPIGIQHLSDRRYKNAIKQSKVKMAKDISPIIKPDALIALKQKKALVIIDVRTGANAYEVYEKTHLEGALFVDLELQLAEKTADAANGGRHPLPTAAQFALVLSQLGITPKSHIIVYDAQNGANAAARFWWMLKAVGHAKVQVIDGGLDGAIKAGFPLSSKKETPLIGKKYKADKWLLPLADLEEVEKATQNAALRIIDVRSKERFDGKSEPIDLIAGHIPNAINVPFFDNLDADGFFYTPSVLREKYDKIIDGKPSEAVIVHCGSGVTACHTLLAMAYAGIEIPKLYIGSWSEWSRNELPIATEL
jgi:thiosulfate/3-mercaptopyruvate sulfurtransferase